MKNKYRGSFVKANFWTCKNLCQSEITLTETILNEDIKIIAAHILPCEIAHCGIWKQQWMPPMSMSNQYAHSFEQGRWGDSLANNLTHKEV